ncbi:MAG: cyclase family protein, partial [Candidatus Methylomirabilales bacterium]
MKSRFIVLQVVAILVFGAVGNAEPGYDPAPPASPWGPADEAGNTNLLTPEKALAAKKHIKTGLSFVLAHDSENGMPLAPGNTWVQTAKGPIAVNKQVANADQIIADFTQDGTQFDALCHQGYLPNGTLSPVTDAVYYNQFHHLDVVGVDGLKLCGVDKLRPYVTKAILVDVSRYLFANQVMPEGTAITVDMALA